MRRIRHAIARGFTLVEIAIVLVVIGLLLSGGLIAVTPILDSAARSQVESQLDAIEDALIVYAIQNNCLPCPANGVDTTTADIGRASAGTSVHYGTGCAPNGSACDVTGSAAIVPWVNLGLSRADVIDPYGAFIGYHINPADTEVYQLDGSSNPQFLRDTSQTGANQYPNTNAGSITVTANDTTTTGITTAAAYVLISYGQDRDEATMPQLQTGTDTGAGGVIRADLPAGSADPLQDDNNDGAFNNFRQGGQIDASNNYFDDIVRFKTTPLIIQQCGSGGCGNP